MNRQYLLDSLDGFKGLVFRLLGPELLSSIGCVPMTTDGPWTDEEKAIFEKAIGIPGDRTYGHPEAILMFPQQTIDHHVHPGSLLLPQ
jgi:hypothetical protein